MAVTTDRDVVLHNNLSLAMSRLEELLRLSGEEVMIAADNVENDSSQKLDDDIKNQIKRQSLQTENSPKRVRLPSHTTYSEATARETEKRPRILLFETRHADPFICLPPEVITHVLSYLPLRDRKSVRLTCKTLNHCSKHVSIVKREKLVFPGSLTVSSSYVREILLRTNYVPLNLEFYGATRPRLKGLTTDVWRMFGDRVHNLYFNCPLGIRILVDILRNCGNLRVFAFRGYPDGRNHFHLRRALDHLIQSNVVCSQLHTLTFDSGSINCRLLRKIVTVFPNLKHLDAIFWERTDELEKGFLNPFMQLQSLTFHSTPNSAAIISGLEYQCASQFGMRLTEFKINLCDSDVESAGAQSYLLRFLASQNQLEKLSLSFLGVRSGYKFIEKKKMIMFHALKSSPKLRQFTFDCDEMYLETAEEALEFLSLILKLRHLNLQNLPCIPDGLSLPSTNFALRKLDVISRRTGSRKLFLYILEHSPKLQDLEISSTLTIQTFKTIVYNMPTLRTLLIYGEFIGDLSTLDEDCRIGLENLEYLRLVLNPFEALPILCRIHFRRMKRVKFVFHIDGACQYMNLTDKLHEVLWNMPTVETIELPQLKLENCQHYIGLFQHLKDLRRIVCAEVESRDLEFLFKSCRSLKFVSSRRKNHRRTFTFDSSADRVISEPYLTLEEQGCMSVYLRLYSHN